MGPGSPGSEGDRPETGAQASPWGHRNRTLRVGVMGGRGGGRVVLRTGGRVNAGVKRPACPSWSRQACGSGVGESDGGWRKLGHLQELRFRANRLLHGLGLQGAPASKSGD